MTANLRLAKLCRLMSSDLPLTIEPEKLAASGERLAGTLGLEDMHRVRELILNPEGDVSFDLAFSRDDRGMTRITGKVSSRLKMTCQRCLNEMDYHLDNPVKVGLARDPEAVKLLPDFLEPFVTGERTISLLKLIEDELLLGLPMSPLHEPEDCPALNMTREHAPGRVSPFAVLKDLKSGKP